MAHELTEQDSMLSASGRRPWHFNLGTPVNVVDGEVTVADAPALAGLDWLVEHRPLYIPITEGINPDGTEAVRYEEIPNNRAVVRVDTDAHLGVVGMQHTLIQNQTLFDLAGAIQAEADGDVLIETAGSLKGGKLVWVLAVLDRELEINGDKHIPYLLLAQGHDGSLALRAQVTPMRVVCWNTLSWAITNTVMAWIARHSSGVATRVEDIRQTLGMSWAYLDGWEAEVREMMETTIAPRRFDRFTERLIPIQPDPTDRMVAIATERRDQLRSLYEGPTVGDFTGTQWGAFNAATEWLQWERPIQGTPRDERLGDRAVNGDIADETTRVRRLLADAVA